jgi:DNA-binding MarR family transcriptional regulator
MKRAIWGKILNGTMARMANSKNGRIPLKMTVIGTVGAAAFNTNTLRPTGGEISRIMLVAGANITGIAKRLESDGFIIKKSDPTDHQVTILEITPK